MITQQLIYSGIAVASNVLINSRSSHVFPQWLRLISGAYMWYWHVINF